MGDQHPITVDLSVNFQSVELCIPLEICNNLIFLSEYDLHLIASN